MGMGKAGQGGTEMVVWDTVGDIIWALPSTRRRGLWPRMVTTHRQPDTTFLAIQKSLPRAQSDQWGQMPSPRCPSSFLFQWGDRCQVRNTKVITFSSFQSSSKAQAHNRDTRNPRARKVSSLETGYSIRVTPTCKTETTALTKLGLPPKEGGSSTSQAPAGGGEGAQGHGSRQDGLLLP